MQKQPLVTACLTVYNAEAFIEKTIESIKSQTWKNLRILVSDDCSNDATFSLINRAIGSANNQFQVFRQCKRLGWVGNTNFLLNKVESDLFFLCYHDDLLEPEYVEDIVNCMLETPGVVGAYCDLHFKGLNNEYKTLSYQEICNIDDPVQRGLSIIRREGNAWVANRGIFTRSVLEKVGNLRLNLAGEFAAAYPWILGLALEGKFKRIPRILCHKTHLSTGVSRQWKYLYSDKIALYHDMFRTIWGSSLSDVQKDRLLLEVSYRIKEILEKRTVI